MKYKRIAPLLALCMLLTGCMASMPEERLPSGQSLPTFPPGPPAPVGDSQMERNSTVGLFVPDPNTLKLTLRPYQNIVLEPGQSRPEAAVEALLRVINEENLFYRGTQPLRLAQVSNAVETSGELATVNLHTSAQMLRDEALFALRVAITNTLTALPEINYVNVLIDGRDIGLDFEGTLPTGVLSNYPSGDVNTLWGQMDMQREAVGEELQKTAALYYVSADGTSLLSEVRNITFPERDMARYAKNLLEEMTVLANDNALRIVVPPVDLFFERDPIYARPEGYPVGYIHLYMHEEIDNQLLSLGSTRAMLMSSICYTLTSFIPQLEGVYFYIGGELVTQVTMMDGNEWFHKEGLMTRADLAGVVADMCTVYFPVASGDYLRAVSRSIPQRHKTQPRALIRELMNPPTNGSLGPALPEGTTDADVLGIQIVGDTALINFSTAFAEACRNMPPDKVSSQRRNMIYAIVNTLTELDGVSRVRFYFNGVQDAINSYDDPTDLTSPKVTTYGEFLRNIGLVR